MNWKYIIVAFVILVILAFFYFSRGEVVVVHMSGSKYEPSRLTIAKGTTVRFANEATSSGDFWPASNIHPRHEIYPEFDPKKAISQGDSWDFRFDKKGIWYMHDHIDPTITGVIVVE